MIVFAIGRISFVIVAPGRAVMCGHTRNFIYFILYIPNVQWSMHWRKCCFYERIIISGIHIAIQAPGFAAGAPRVQICRTLQTPFENVLHDLRVLRQETFRIALAGKSGDTDQQKLVAQFFVNLNRRLISGKPHQQRVQAFFVLLFPRHPDRDMPCIHGSNTLEAPRLPLSANHASFELRLLPAGSG